MDENAADLAGMESKDRIMVVEDEIFIIDLFVSVPTREPK